MNASFHVHMSDVTCIVINDSSNVLSGICVINVLHLSTFFLSISGSSSTPSRAVMVISYYKFTCLYIFSYIWFFIFSLCTQNDVPRRHQLTKKKPICKELWLSGLTRITKVYRSIHLILPSVETAELERIQREGNSSGKNAICYSVIKWDIFLLLVKQIRRV